MVKKFVQLGFGLIEKSGILKFSTNCVCLTSMKKYQMVPNFEYSIEIGVVLG